MNSEQAELTFVNSSRLNQVANEVDKLQPVPLIVWRSGRRDQVMKRRQTLILAPKIRRYGVDRLEGEKQLIQNCAWNYSTRV